jgi:hypothetical protein
VGTDSSLLLIDSDINIDPDATEALGMLINQFPDDYLTPEQRNQKPKGPTDAEKELAAKTEMLQYSNDVAKGAAESTLELDKAEEDKKEAHAYEGLDEEAMIQLKANPVILAQTENKGLNL